MILDREYYNSIVKLRNIIIDKSVEGSTQLGQSEKIKIDFSDNDSKSKCSPPSFDYNKCGEYIGYRNLERMCFEGLVIKHPELKEKYCLDTNKAEIIISSDKNYMNKIFSNYEHVMGTVSMLLSIVSLIIAIFI